MHHRPAMQPIKQSTFSGTRPAFGQTCPQSPPVERMSGSGTPLSVMRDGVIGMDGLKVRPMVRVGIGAMARVRLG